jgi:hypothetical protein
MLSPLRKCLTIAGACAAGIIAFTAATANAEQPNGGAGAAPAMGAPAGGVPRGVGGYSMTLSDIWGPPKMPPAPKDFGPGFDFPPEPLNGGLTQDPYPN